MTSCPYKNIFGKPGEGPHKHRIFGVAAVDLLGTVLIAVLIGMWKKYSIVGIAALFIGLMILSLILHRLFCVETTLTKKVFGKF
jgi:hypothetical protein